MLFFWGREMVKVFSYGIFDRVAFYCSYFWYKLILPFEVKSPRFSMWGYELLYTVHKFRDYEYCLPWTAATNIISTRFGSFKIRSNTADAANVSPAFERRDMNNLFRLLSRLKESEKRVLFLDIGGDLGTYSITVGNRFRSDPINIICFEPIPSSCQLIRENLERNQLSDKVEVMEIALMDEPQDDLEICLNVMAPGSSSVKGSGEVFHVSAKCLDSLMQDHLKQHDAIVIKLDVEGVEECVLRGAVGLLNSGIEIYLMVEDFIDESIITYLEDTGWIFVGKKTSYNSWWKKHAKISLAG